MPKTARKKVAMNSGKSRGGSADAPVMLAGGNPQIPKGDGERPVRAYIAAMPGWKRDVGRSLDALIVRALPDVRKAVRWNSPFYGVEGRGWFLSFHCYARYVKVAFFRGTSLRPMPPAESKQKDVRYLDIAEGEQIDAARFTDWVKQAAEIPGWEPGAAAPDTPGKPAKTTMKNAKKPAEKTASTETDWRGEMLARVRILIHQADKKAVEEVKWAKPSNPVGVPVWSHDGIICTGETYKDKVKLTFARGAALEDPAGLFNASLEGNTRRAIDLHEGDKIDAGAFKELVRAAVALNGAGRDAPARPRKKPTGA